MQTWVWVATPLLATPVAHPVLVASSNPTHTLDDTISTNNYNVLVATIGKVEAKQAPVVNKRSSVDKVGQQERALPFEGYTADPPTTSWFCIILSKSSMTDSATYNNIKALPFATIHTPYKSKYSNGYKINPDNCLQWLNTSCLALAIAFLFNVHFVTNVQY